MTEGENARSTLALSGTLLVLFAGLLVVNAAVGVVRAPRAGLLDALFSCAVLGVCIVIKRKLRPGAIRAWLGGVGLALGGLFFIAPVVGTMLLGGGLEPVGTGWDVVYFPLMTLALSGALAGLHRARHAVLR